MNANRIAEPARPTAGGSAPLYLRTVAAALERRMMQDPESSVHWVAVVDENPHHAPARVWECDVSTLQVGMTEGSSEGMLISVHAQSNRYEPANLTALLRVKVLCGAPRAAGELLQVWKFFQSREFEEMLNPSTAAPAVSPSQVAA